MKLKKQSNETRKFHKQRDKHKDHIVNISGFYQLKTNEKFDLAVVSNKLIHISPSNKLICPSIIIKLNIYIDHTITYPMIYLVFAVSLGLTNILSIEKCIFFRHPVYNVVSHNKFRNIFYFLYFTDPHYSYNVEI